ncbi:MAG TPA: hypothetical protein VER08_05600 [Pyrinomonadaceae bacterium]|nr:hypothetical protein [Pyrinomonadaceae bacterium]
MATEREMQQLYDRIAALRQTVTNRLGVDLISNPQLADALVKQIDDMLASVEEGEARKAPPPDSGLAELIGLGPGAARELGTTRLPSGVERYDETVTSERITAMADLYYIYQHERIGVFRAMQKLQELFRAGTVRLSSGPGAYGLYQFDRRQVLRFTRRDRLAAYCRAFGYCMAPPPPGARPNTRFHQNFSAFIGEVTQYWRDKRVSDVIRERAYDPSFGSIATVRRAGLDLRNDLKFASYGNLNVLRVEVMQLLDETFRILGTEDVRRLFGADNAWDVVEEILTHYFNERLETSPRQRMAVAGREILRWLSQPHLLQTTRTQFEALLLQIAEHAEEWLMSAESIGLTEQRRPRGRVLSLSRDRSSSEQREGGRRAASQAV